MESLPTVSAVAHTIQLAVAPVFLLAGIGSMLNVLTARLGRVIDRARWLEAGFSGFDEATRALAVEELGVLDRRMAVCHRAITCCTASALFVCLVVAILFLADIADRSFARTVAGLFIFAMGLIVVGLLYFLAEIRLATRSVRVRSDLLPEVRPRARR